jgi:hypothetical protein
VTTDDPLQVVLDSIKIKEKTESCKNFQDSAKPSSFFAKVQNKYGEIEYLSASTEEEIEVYCEGGVLGDELAIEEWCQNVTPIMVIKHFKWVGTRRNPFVVARPIYVNEAVTNNSGQTVYRLKEMREFKEKF